MGSFWVVGGEYTDTSFERPVGEGAERRFGPFPTYEAAKAEWQRLAWASVDNAHARYRIEEDAGAAPFSFWVVGGTYKDTGFKEPAEGGESWLGPFATYDEAKAEWQRRSWASVDDALARYRIERLAGDRRP